MSIKNSLEYPKNLFRDIYDENEIDGILNQIYYDGLKDALNRLTLREYECILYRYKDKMTYEEIGKIYSLTRDSIRQIIVKAIRKLRHPTIQAMYEVISRTEYNKLIKENAILSAKIEKLENLLSARCEEIGVSIDKYEFMAEISEMDIAELELSTRTYHALKRAGKNYIKDIAAMSVNQLKEINNFGVHSVKEVTEKLRKLGIKIKCNNEEY